MGVLGGVGVPSAEQPYPSVLVITSGAILRQGRQGLSEMQGAVGDGTDWRAEAGKVRDQGVLHRVGKVGTTWGPIPMHTK